MIRRPPRSTRTYTLFPYTTLFRSRESKAGARAVGDVAPTYAIRVSCPFAMPMRPLVGRGYAPDTRAVSEAVAPMANACEPRTKVRTNNRRGSSTALLFPRLPTVRAAHPSAHAAGHTPPHPLLLPLPSPP